MAMSSRIPGQSFRNFVDKVWQDESFRDWVFGGRGSCTRCGGTGTVYADVCDRCARLRPRTQDGTG